MFRSSGTGQWMPSRQHFFAAPRRWRQDGTAVLTLLLPGRSGTAADFFPVSREALAWTLGEVMPVLAVSTTPQTWGANAVTAAGNEVDDAIAFARATWNLHPDRLKVLGISMGALSTLVAARRFIDELAAVALITPVVGLQSMHDANRGGWATEIEAAHGGLAALEAGYSTHDPLVFADQFDGVPIRSWYSTDDWAADAGDVLAFTEAAGDAASAVSVGAQGHTAPGIETDVREFLASHA